MRAVSEAAEDGDTRIVGWLIHRSDRDGGRQDRFPRRVDNPDPKALLPNRRKGKNASHEQWPQKTETVRTRRLALVWPSACAGD